MPFQQLTLNVSRVVLRKLRLAWNMKANGKVADPKNNDIVDTLVRAREKITRHYRPVPCVEPFFVSVYFFCQKIACALGLWLVGAVPRGFTLANHRCSGR